MKKVSEYLYNIDIFYMSTYQTDSLVYENAYFFYVPNGMRSDSSHSGQITAIVELSRSPAFNNEWVDKIKVVIDKLEILN
jgi:hypothetical protein